MSFRSAALVRLCIASASLAGFASALTLAAPPGEHPRGRHPEHPDGPPHAPDEDKNPWLLNHEPEDAPNDLPLLEMFPPDEALRKPLDEQARAELEDFAQRELRGLYQVMKRLEDRDPEEFKRRMGQIAPRLRHLKSIYDHDQEIGRLVIKHVLNTKSIRDTHQRLHRGSKRPMMRRRFGMRVRRLVAENVRIETRLLTWHLENQANQIDDRANELVDLVICGSVEPDQLPEPVRNLLDEWTLAGDQRRREIEAEFHVLAKYRIREELSYWHRRVQELNENPDEIIDRRVRFVMMSRPPRDQDEHRPPRHDREERHANP